MKKIAVLAIILVVGIVSFSCASGVSQTEYDRVSGELSSVRGEIAALQGKMAGVDALQAKYDELNAKNDQLSKLYDEVNKSYAAVQAQYQDLNNAYSGLSKQYATLKGDYGTLQNEYDDLRARYEELSKQSGAVTGGTTEFTTGDIEQTIFQLINQERENKGLKDLLWGENLYTWARDNNTSMITNKREEYSSYPSWQEIFWATEYSSKESIAKAAMTIWKNGEKFELNILNINAIYGAVAARKSGEIYYITYIGSAFR